MRGGLLGMILGGGAPPDNIKDVATGDKPAPKTVPDFTLPDAAGQKHGRAGWKDSKAVVLFFIATECPVSNGYAPECARLAKEFGARGVAVYGVQSDPDVTAEA